MATHKEGDKLSSHHISSPQEKPCRACTDFRSWMSSQATGGPGRPGKALAAETAPSSTTDDSKTQTNSSSGDKLAENQSEAKAVDTEADPPLWGDAEKYGCPADSISLGRGSWRLLHSMAAYYPAQPTSSQQEDMKTFISLFSKFYPCQPCAEDFREWLKSHTPPVESGSGLSRWFCEAHNEVNRKLGKPLFNCDLVDQRWRDGWSDGSCD